MTAQSTDQDRHIIVGVDGSRCSKTALRWAMSQARQTGATVEAIASWEDRAMYGTGIGYAWLAPTADADTAGKAALTALDEAVAEVSALLDQPVKVLTRVVQGHPAQVLTTAAARARLLVVGTRGHGTFAGILLGSVSQHCVQHAPCPVVVVPPDTEHTSTNTPVSDDAWSQA